MKPESLSGKRLLFASDNRGFSGDDLHSPALPAFPGSHVSQNYILKI